MPAWLDRFLRVSFLGVVMGPSLAGVDLWLGYPVLTSLLVLYMVPYCDLQEQRGGRTNLYLVGASYHAYVCVCVRVWLLLPCTQLPLVY